MSDGQSRQPTSSGLMPHEPIASTSAVTLESAASVSAAASASAQEQQQQQHQKGTSAGQSADTKVYSRSTNPQRPTVPTQTFSDGSKGVPDRFELCEMEALIDLLANMLERVIQHNDQLPLIEANLTRFHSRAPPGISVTDYLRRIVQWTPVEPAALLILLLYIETISNKLPGFTINSLTVHRFLITGLMLAAKALSDSFMTNVRYAKVGGLTLVEINVLEREMLQALDYCLHSPGQLLAAFYRNLVDNHPGYSILKTDRQDRFSRATAPDTASDVLSASNISNASAAATHPDTVPLVRQQSSEAAVSPPTTTNGSSTTSAKRRSGGTHDVSALKRKLSSANLFGGPQQPSPAVRAGDDWTGNGGERASPRHQQNVLPPETPSKRSKTPLLAAVDRGDPHSSRKGLSSSHSRTSLSEVGRT